MKDFISFLKKDLYIEAREKSVIFSSLCLSVMLNLFFGLSLSRALLQQSVLTKIQPSIFLIVTVIVLFLSIERTFDSERKSKSIERFLVVEKRSPVSFFLSKLTVLFLISCITIIFSSYLLSIFSGASVLSASVLILLVIPLSLSVSSLGICLGAMTSESKLKFILILLLGIPLLSPLFFMLLEALFDVIVKNEEIHSNSWFHTSLAISSVYILSSLFVFKRIITNE